MSSQACTPLFHLLLHLLLFLLHLLLFSRWKRVKTLFSAVVKTALDIHKIILDREYHNYKMPDIASCPYIRNLIDIIPNSDDACGANASSATEIPPLVFEWMEQDLRTVLSVEFRENSDLPKLIAKSVLSALALLKTRYSAIHSGTLSRT